MAETLEVTTQDQPADMAEQKIYDPSSLWQRLALGGVMLSTAPSCRRASGNPLRRLQTICLAQLGQVNCMIVQQHIEGSQDKEEL